MKNGYDLKCYQLENYEDISKKKSVLKCIYQKYDIEFFKNVIIQHKYNKFAEVLKKNGRPRSCLFNKFKDYYSDKYRKAMWVGRFIITS